MGRKRALSRAHLAFARPARDSRSGPAERDDSRGRRRRSCDLSRFTCEHLEELNHTFPAPSKSIISFHISKNRRRVRKYMVQDSAPIADVVATVVLRGAPASVCFGDYFDLLLDGHQRHRRKARRQDQRTNGRGPDAEKRQPHVLGDAAAGICSVRCLRNRAYAAVNSTPYMRITEEV